MNNQLITKIIKTDDASSCPELLYENPLIDRNVAGALARSFVKILRISQQDSNINTNVRHSVLANIRKLCRIEPENHLEVDENLTKNLSELYVHNLRTSESNDSITCLDRSLDDFLVRRMKDVDLSSSYQRSMSPEVVQALLNLNENQCLESLISKNVLHWDVSDKKNLALVKNLWTNISLSDCAGSSNICGDVSIKMKSEIELILLNLCHHILTEPNLEIDDLFIVNHTLKDLINKCSLSSECYQICYSILNHVFIDTNFNMDIQIFISKFVQNVKANCSDSISILYPTHLSFIIVLLDINLDSIPGGLKDKYIQETRIQIRMCHNKSETDLILVLSHFPHWFHVYFP